MFGWLNRFARRKTRAESFDDLLDAQIVWLDESGEHPPAGHEVMSANDEPGRSLVEPSDESQ